MTTYNWELIERLLHEVQNGADHGFAPRAYAEEHATAQAAKGEAVGNLDELKALAADYEALLLKRGFIESRPEEEGGNGENFRLTPRGSSLLCLLDSSIPGTNHPMEVLDAQVDALDPHVFDDLASKAQIA